MKKMTFALACASAVAAFAAAEDSAVISSINFDAYTAPFTGLDLKKDDGSQGAVTDSRWLYLGASGSTDASTVKAYVPADDSNPNYLELSTEGGTLWRTIDPLSDSSAVFGWPREVPAGGLYIDTMVQFTPTEDGGVPTIDTDNDKLAIWLDVDSSGAVPVTNLCVLGSYISNDGADAVTNVYKATNKAIDAGTWYRLTVKAVPAIDGNALVTDGILGFEVSIDNTPIVFDKMTMDEGSLGYLSETDKDAIEAKTVVASALGLNASATLQAVGFKGSGAIDSLQFTTQDPNKGSADVVPVTGVSLDKSSATLTVGETLTLNATVAPENASDTTVTWSVTDGGVVTVDGGVVTAVKAGTATVTVTTKDGSKTATCTVTVNPIAVTATVTLSPTTAEWAADLKLPTPTVTGAPEGATSNGAWDGSIPDANPTVPVTLTYTVTFTGNYSGTASATFTVTPQNKKYPTYISKDNQEAYDAWVSKYSVGDREDSTEALLDAFLLNVAPAEAEAEAGKFTITSITIDATGKVTVVAPAKNSKGDAFNGTVEVKGAATVDAAKYELKTTDPTARFFKAFLVLEAPAAK